MNAIEIELPDGGVLAGLDFGGRGTPVLLVHGSGHNAAAWRDVAERLVAHCHVVAIDLRGHGQTSVDSTSPEQYWRDLEHVCRTLGPRPVLVGHSTGGYVVCAATAAGLVEPRAICVVDGVTLDDRETAAKALANWSTPEGLQQLRDQFRYGWLATDEQMTAYVEECARTSASDWLNAGARPELVREVTRRAFVRRGDQWLRRPTLDEIKIVSRPDPVATTYPSLDVYAAIRCPLAIVIATEGFYFQRRGEVDKIVEAGPNRRRIDIASNHNVPMTHAAELADAIIDVVRSATPRESK